MLGCFSFSLEWYSHPVNYVNYAKHNRKQNLKYKYLLIEKELGYTVDELSARLFEMNNILKIFL